MTAGGGKTDLAFSLSDLRFAAAFYDRIAACR